IGVVLNGLKAEISPDYEYHDKYYYYYGSEHKKPLTLDERISSWPEQVRKYLKDLPRKLSNFRKEERKIDINIRSLVLKIVLLLLAIGLLIAGLYYQRTINKPVQAPVRQDNVTITFPPPKVQTGPAPVALSEDKDKPSGEK
ncbi:MAG TPA: hypothetical protein VJZ16_04835, partial [Syntrophales bacterium]|nr:hypothetical protein [Syntrophales bacterium]